MVIEGHAVFENIGTLSFRMLPLRMECHMETHWGKGGAAPVTAQKALRAQPTLLPAMNMAFKFGISVHAFFFLF